MYIPAPNHTQCPNVLLDEWLPKLREGELKVLLVIIRKIFGWHKTHDIISISQLEKITGLTRSNVINSINKLIDKGLVTKQIKGEFGREETHYTLVIKQPVSEKYPPSPEEIPPPVSEKDSQKKLIQNKEQVCMSGAAGPEKSGVVEKCEITHPNGKKTVVSFNQVIEQSILQGIGEHWLMGEMQEAFDVMKKYKGQISDWFKFIHGTIDKIRLKKQNESYNHKKEKPCQTKPTKQDLNPELKAHKERCLEPAMKEPLLASFCPLHMSKKKSPNS